VNYYAHTATLADGSPDPDTGRWQTLADHSRQVAALARRFGEPIGLGDEAELAGLLHDLGKYREEFQSYLRGQRVGGVETQHAIYGAAWAFSAEALAATFGVAGHHAGLHDQPDLVANVSRQTVKVVVDKLVACLELELGPLPKPSTIPQWVESAGNPNLAAELYVRMLFSCLVDADRLDTATWPATVPEDAKLRAETHLCAIEAERERKRAQNPDSPLSDLRNRIFEACRAGGSKVPGFFSLTVPTGGGKTLSSMAFALAHAQAHNLRRVIVVIPYLSIIEQNAAEYRRILGDHVVLENHSNVAVRADSTEEEKSRLDLVSENWDAPVVVTTSVQFIESLFASNPSKCRKLHRIARSVVIFDEVQTLPTQLLKPMFSVFRELVRTYGVSFVFSSATQPAFRKSTALPDGFGADELRELAPDPADLFLKLRRVNYHLPRPGDSLDWPELATRLAEETQVLCVVNLTRHAKVLWEQLKRLLPSAESPIHLSSAMCPAHRLALIENIRIRLREGLPCRVVSTQLIEAGVDVDFPSVWRSMGPLDSIVQVAGRCNREGRRPSGNVHVFRPADHKLPPGVYRAASDQAVVTLAYLGDEALASERLGSDPKIFRGYFDSLYQLVNTDHAKRGETTIQDDRELLRFREVSRKAKVIEDSGQPVIVSRDNCRREFGYQVIEVIRNRLSEPGRSRFARDDLRALQRYMVNVHHHRFQQLESMRHIRPLLPNLDLYVLADGFYDPDLGLVIENRPLDDYLA
jgi:CRISPR-associated endonuclease/helicase Cas3